MALATNPTFGERVERYRRIAIAAAIAPTGMAMTFHRGVHSRPISSDFAWQWVDHWYPVQSCHDVIAMRSVLMLWLLSVLCAGLVLRPPNEGLELQWAGAAAGRLRRRGRRVQTAPATS